MNVANVQVLPVPIGHWPLELDTGNNGKLRPTRWMVEFLALATFFDAQLRRSRDAGQESADGAVDPTGLFARGGVDGDDSLPRMARQPRDARLEERTGGDGLAVRPVAAVGKLWYNIGHEH